MKPSVGCVFIGEYFEMLGIANLRTPLLLEFARTGQARRGCPPRRPFSSAGG